METGWRNWLLLGGRGSGKTRAGAEFVRFGMAMGLFGRVALVGPTLGDVREVMIEGVSGLRSITDCYDCFPTYSPSRRRLEYPNGATAMAFSAEDADSLRGPQFDAAWCDEIAAWPDGETVWDTLQMGVRLGHAPVCVATTTPRPVPLVQRLVEGEAVVSRMSAGTDPTRLTPRVVCKRAANLGRLASAWELGPENRWDDHASLELDWYGDALESVGDRAALAGQSLFLVETELGWELMAAAQAELVGSQRWRLSRLIRGLGGSQAARSRQGALCVKVGDGLSRADLDPAETGVDLYWQAGRSNLQPHTFENVRTKPWRVGHLRSVSHAGGREYRHVPG